MLSRSLRHLAHSASLQLERVAGIRPSVEISDYPVRPRPRWGHGLPAHPRLAMELEQGREVFSQLLQGFLAHREALHAVSYRQDRTSPTRPFWNNIWFSALDAASLVALLLDRAPGRYFEIGSGHSTMFARYAVHAGDLPTKIISLDPEPRAAINALCDEVLREPLETSDLRVFDTLNAGDVLFFDGSHRVFTNSDVTAFFFDVMPRIAPGVLVHIHDVFWPWDYPPSWSEHFYSEQYLLGAMLLAAQPPFHVVLPNFFVCNDDNLSAIVRDLFHHPSGTDDIPFFYPGVPGNVPGVSFWLETISPPHFD